MLNADGSVVCETNVDLASGAASGSALDTRLAAIENRGPIGFAYARGTGQYDTTTGGVEQALPGRTLTYTKLSSTSKLRLLYKDNVSINDGGGTTQTLAMLRIKVNGQTCQNQIQGTLEINITGTARATVVAVGICEGLLGVAGGLPAGPYTISASVFPDLSNGGTPTVRVNDQNLYNGVPWYLEVQELP